MFRNIFVPVRRCVTRVADMGRREKCFNQVTLVGRLGGDPELRGTEDRPYAIFRVATSERWKRDEEWLEKTNWHKIIMFNKGRAIWCANNLKRGSRVIIFGKLQNYDSETLDKEGNVFRYRTTSTVADYVMPAQFDKTDNAAYGDLNEDHDNMPDEVIRE